MSAEQPAPRADNDRRGFRHWQEWEVVGREIRSVLCVATGIELRPGHPGFDQARLQSLIDDAHQIMRCGDNPVDILRVMPESEGSQTTGPQFA